MKRNPSILSYQSAADTLYEPSALSVISTDRLAEAFIRIDRQLRDGFSRILLITVLEKVKIILCEPLQSGMPMTADQQKAFLMESGFNNPKAQLLSSMSMKDFYQLIESKIESDHSNELKFIDAFLVQLELKIIEDVRINIMNIQFDKNVDKLVDEKLKTL